MSSRLSSILARLNAGTDSGDLVHLTGFRQGGTPPHGKRGSVIAFQKAGMSMAVLVLSLRPAAGHELEADLRDTLFFTVAPLQYVSNSLAPFRRWQGMEAAEAEGLVRCWFEGDEHHTLLGNVPQLEAWDAAASSVPVTNISTRIGS